MSNTFTDQDSDTSDENRLKQSFPHNNPKEMGSTSGFSVKDTSPEEIIRLLQQCGESITSEEAISFLETYSSAMENLLQRTNATVSDPAFNPAHFLTADKKGLTDARQNQLFQTLKNLSLRKAASQASTSATDDTAPILFTCTNVVNGSQVVMSGSVVQIQGIHLNFNKIDRSQGLFMVDASGITTRINSMVKHQEDKIVFMIPGGMAAGEYQLEVRTTDLITYEVRTGKFSGTLKVVI